MTPKRTQRQKKDVIVHEISLYQGRDLTYPQASIPPGNLITKHEDATRKEKKRKKKKRGGGGGANEPAPLDSLSQSMKPSLLWLLAMQLHTTCWMLSRECGQQVTRELMKCQDGGREIAYITYPQGALVVFLRISHTEGEMQQDCSHSEESCAAFNS